MRHAASDPEDPRRDDDGEGEVPQSPAPRSSQFRKRRTRSATKKSTIATAQRAATALRLFPWKNSRIRAQRALTRLHSFLTQPQTFLTRVSRPAITRG
jgi:hypothetical protein